MVEIFVGIIKRNSRKIKPDKIRFYLMDRMKKGEGRRAKGKRGGKRCRIHFLFALCLLPFALYLLGGCNDDFDNYSTSPGDVLSFSTDTLRFDTVLTTINTPVNAFMIYNKNKKPLLIAEIALRNAGKSGFKINVDGVSGNSFRDVEIRANDSLYVLVDIKPKETGDNQPVVITDYVDFTTNGIRQTVLLEAHCQDVVILKDVLLSSNTVLDSPKPYLVYDSLVIAPGVTVDVAAGTTFFMHANASIIVKGTLRINGTLEEPVTIRGDRMDWLLPTIPYDRVPGQWGNAGGSIRFDSLSYHNVFEYAYIRNGINGLLFERSEPSELKMTLKNVVLTNFRGELIRATNCRIIAENCEFSNSQQSLLYLIGGNYSFTHCTMANCYLSGTESGWGNSDNETVTLSTDHWVNSQTYELQADFKNTIIWGFKSNSSSEIRVEKDPKVPLSYQFRNCLLPGKAVMDEHFVNCLWDKDPKFSVTDGNIALYDFRLDSISPARNAADPVISELFPYDIKGIDRFSDEGPDIGGYEWRMKSEKLKIKN
jgi:hypothetical protein